MKPRSTVMGKNGMVVCSQPRASLAGVEVLRRGGNAIDAAVATAPARGAPEPMSIGIGADAFALIHPAGPRALKALDGSGRSPYVANPEFFRRQGMDQVPEAGIHSVTVPGAVAGWAAMLDAHGTLPLAGLLAPSIECAAEGFQAGELTSGHWHKSEAKLKKNPAAAAAYLPGGRAPKAGEIFRQPDLARTLGKIAEQGPAVFYRGEIAEKIVRCSEQLGGRFSLKDFADHRSDWVEPIAADYRGHTVYELPPATQGIAALTMLKLVEPFDLRALEPGGAEHLHLLIEAKKLAFADRDRYLADRDFMRVPWRALLSDARLEAMRQTNSRGRARPEAPTVPLEADTEDLALADRGGDRGPF